MSLPRPGHSYLVMKSARKQTSSWYFVALCKMIVRFITKTGMQSLATSLKTCFLQSQTYQTALVQPEACFWLDGFKY